MPSYRDLLKYAKTGIAAPGMSYRDMLRARAIGVRFPVSTIEGVPPISFTGDGKPLTEWTLWGNMAQSGTPTPSNPILPQACGDATNILDNTITAGITDNTYINQSGQTAASDNYYLSFPIWLEPETVYTWSFDSGIQGIQVTHTNPSVAFYTADGTLISSASHDSYIKWFTFTTPANCAYIRGSVYKGYNQNTTMLLKGASSGDGKNILEYQPYGYKIPFTTSLTAPVYLGQTPTLRRIKKLVLTGGDDENWSVVTISANNCIFRLDLSEYPLSGVAPISTHYTGSTADLWVDVADGEVTTSIRNLNAVAIHHIGLSGVTDWKAYLAAQYAAGTPVTVWYAIATPTTGIVNEPLAKIGDYADELHSTDAAVTIPTAKGENTLTVDTDLPPSSVSITGHIK